MMSGLGPFRSHLCAPIQLSLSDFNKPACRVTTILRTSLTLLNFCAAWLILILTHRDALPTSKKQDGGFWIMGRPSCLIHLLLVARRALGAPIVCVSFCCHLRCHCSMWLLCLYNVTQLLMVYRLLPIIDSLLAPFLPFPFRNLSLCTFGFVSQNGFSITESMNIHLLSLFTTVSGASKAYGGAVWLGLRRQTWKLNLTASQTPQQLLTFMAAVGNEESSGATLMRVTWYTSLPRM